jgi:hypothetical protein
MNPQSKARLAAGLIAVLFAFALCAGAAKAASRPAGMSKAEYRALLVRGDALNRKYHLGHYSRVPAGMTAAEYRALLLRSEGLNRAYVAARPARPSVVDTSFEWSAFGIGAAAMAGLVLLASGLIAGGRYGRRVPRARTSS